MKVNRKSKQKLIAFNLFLFALLFVLVYLNKEYVRPAFSHIPFVGVLAGIFPNFIAAFIISLICVNAVVTREPRYGRFIVYVASSLVFAILALEELKPIWGASTHYDSLDILASGVGALLAILTFEMIVMNRKKGDT